MGIVLCLVLSIFLIAGPVQAATGTGGGASGGGGGTAVPVTETMYENYTASNAIDIFYGNNLKGQTFTPQASHRLTCVIKQPQEDTVFTGIGPGVKSGLDYCS